MHAVMRRPRSWWIPWAFVGFFVVVFGANGIMVFFAFDSWTGITTEDAYIKGLDYNEQIADARAQQALGWQGELGFVPNGPQNGLLELKLKDRYGTAISEAVVTAVFVRPTHAGHDLEVALEDAGGGRYAAEVALPLAGQWDVRLRAEHERGGYRLERRILVR